MIYTDGRDGRDIEVRRMNTGINNNINKRIDIEGQSAFGYHPKSPTVFIQSIVGWPSTLQFLNRR